ncbi:HAD family hydrolase [Patulibacter minatonensis]|uniref:HAD family hydrolase n=1 Tax=Patulibacter minatonensis TaxID=298163 RepID=UPI0004BCDE89|nr:HAD family phosphatase [Patulibacter minatonensis]
MTTAASSAALRPAAVVFDNDGTFLETEAVWSRAEEELFRRRGIAFLPEHKLELIGTSFAHASVALEGFLGEPGGGPAIMEELVALVHVELDGDVPVMPGADRLVDALRARGVAVGMATNAGRGFAEKALHRAGHADTFPVLLTAEDVTSPKPAPEIYLAAAAALGVDPADCVAVEDSPTGVTAAVAAGMTVLGVTSFPGVDLSHAHHRHPSLEDPALWALLGLDDAV